MADAVLGPGEASSNGNVTGGRKLARYDFGRRAISASSAPVSPGRGFSLPRSMQHCELSGPTVYVEEWDADHTAVLAIQAVHSHEWATAFSPFFVITFKLG